MSTMKDQSEKVIGSVKGKIGNLLNDKQLEEDGKEQIEKAAIQIQKKKDRLRELEDSYDEFAAKKQDFTKEQIKQPQKNEPFEPVDDTPHISSKQQREEIRMKHYTGIEEKFR
ncbi:hypothetical protein IGI37_001506 [Enterococcus sp. AZ194]|uniref:CsbD family protein n=1 Tax=Enterococcus sp. AZ194 TaxID=2774629 RepID=UPI003F22BEB8